MTHTDLSAALRTQIELPLSFTLPGSSSQAALHCFDSATDRDNFSSSHPFSRIVRDRKKRDRGDFLDVHATSHVVSRLHLSFVLRTHA